MQLLTGQDVSQPGPTLRNVCGVGSAHLLYLATSAMVVAGDSVLPQHQQLWHDLVCCCLHA